MFPSVLISLVHVKLIWAGFCLSWCFLQRRLIAGSESRTLFQRGFKSTAYGPGGEGVDEDLCKGQGSWTMSLRFSHLSLKGPRAKTHLTLSHSEDFFCCCCCFKHFLHYILLYSFPFPNCPRILSISLSKMHVFLFLFFKEKQDNPPPKKSKIKQMNEQK